EQSQYPIYNLTTPLNHFPTSPEYPATNQTFPLRYIIDTSHYQPGGPVFVIAGGETSALNRIPFLSQGIVHELARIYQGVALIAEHRYYGTSYPSQQPEGKIPLSSLKYLTTEQAVEDYAYLATHLPPILATLLPTTNNHTNTNTTLAPSLSPRDTPWIIYGGSYAGFHAALTRRTHPKTYHAAISSSGVTAAIIDYWQYYEAIRLHAPKACVETQQTLIEFTDRVLRYPAPEYRAQLKGIFGGRAPGLDDQAFVAELTAPLGLFQDRNWDPRVGGWGFAWYCGNLTSPIIVDEGVEGEVGGVVRGLVQGFGHDEGRKEELVRAVVNWVAFIRRMGVFEDDAKDEIDIEGQDKLLPRSASTSWNYQVCTEWGYFTPGATVPAHIRPLVSRLLTLEYWVDMCNATYGITDPPDVDRINRHGGFAFSYPRVAHIGGLADPWREATPFATGLPPRNATAEEPMLLMEVSADEVYDGMEGAVHHWDQNGVFGVDEGKRVVPPRGVREAQGEIVGFVGGWLGEWR
ncbi:putative extracelular serine carboxypeptidase, partial [Aspergillus homomorphus CBS 101889]